MTAPVDPYFDALILKLDELDRHVEILLTNKMAPAGSRGMGESIGVGVLESTSLLWRIITRFKGINAS